MGVARYGACVRILIAAVFAAAPAASIASDAASSDPEGKILVLNFKSEKPDNGDTVVIVDADKHVISAFEYSKDHKSVIPIAFRNYQFDLLLKEFPNPELKNMTPDKGLSSWVVRYEWEKHMIVKMKDDKEIDSKTKKEEIDKKLEEKLKEAVASGKGKTFLLAANVMPGGSDASKEQFILIDAGSNAKNQGAVVMMAYAIEFTGPAAGAIVPKAIRRVSDDAKIADFKLAREAKDFQYFGDFRNKGRENLTFEQMGNLLKRVEKKEEEKEDEKKDVKKEGGGK